MTTIWHPPFLSGVPIVVKMRGYSQEEGWRILEALDVLDKAFQTRDFSGTADQAAVQADAHHLGRFGLPFGVKHVEAIFEVLKELLSGDVARHAGRVSYVELA